MDVDLSRERLALRESVRQFIEAHVLPHIMPYERESKLPLEIFREAGRRGFLKAHIPLRFGGTGLGTPAFCLVSEELAKAGFGMTHNGHFQTQNPC